jgi:hypothetical protein
MSSAETKVGLDRILDAYDAVHDGLAVDDLTRVRTAAIALEHEAERAADQAPAVLRDHLVAIGTHAKGLMTATTLLEARKTFGGLSRHTIALLDANPSLAAGRRVFECPMVADGFNRWIQTSPRVENPYFGTEMSSCGSLVGP